MNDSLTKLRRRPMTNGDPPSTITTAFYTARLSDVYPALPKLLAPLKEKSSITG